MDDNSWFEPRAEQFHDQMVRWYPEYGGKTLELTFQVTADCNMCCSYCYQINKKPEMMTLDVAKKGVRLLHDQKLGKYSGNYACVIIDFIGGEPLLAEGLCEDIMSYYIIYGAEKGVDYLGRSRFLFSTNGTLTKSPEVERMFKRFGILPAFAVTVDGCKEMHDACRIMKDGSPTYDIACEAADWLKKTRGETNTKLTLHPNNLKYLPEAVKSFHERGFDEIFMNPVFENVWDKESANFMYYQLKKVGDYLVEHPEVYVRLFDPSILGEYNNEHTWCGGADSMLSISPDGRIFPCIRFAETSLGNDQEPFVIGHVDHGLGVTDIEKRNLSLLETCTRAEQVKGLECEHCPISRLCGDCIGHSYQDSGKINYKTTYHCLPHIASALATVYWLKKIGKLTEKQRTQIPEEMALRVISKEEYDKLVSRD